MNPTLARLRDGLTKNKTALGALGVVAVAGLAWRARSSSSSTAATSSATRTSSTSPSIGYSSGGQVSTATGYDSTASDIYNALQPQLEALTDLYNQAATPAPSPIPVPVAEPQTPTAPVVAETLEAVVDGWYRTFLGRGAIPEEEDMVASAIRSGGIDGTTAMTNIANSAEAQMATKYGLVRPS